MAAYAEKTANLSFYVKYIFIKNCQKWLIDILELRYAAASKSQSSPVYHKF